jgi:hypothetical protein
MLAIHALPKMKLLYCSLIFCLLLNWLPSPARAQTESGDILCEAYLARINHRDHYSASGVRLTAVADIVRQDRLNYLRGGIRDAEDQADGLSTGAGYLGSLESLLGRRLIDATTAAAIVESTPLVCVKLYKSKHSGELYLTIDLVPLTRAGAYARH